MDTPRQQADTTGSQLKYRRFLVNESHGLLTRLSQMQPFEMSMPMVTAASIPWAAQRGIYELMRVGKGKLRKKVNRFIKVIEKAEYIPFEKAQSAYAVLKLQFNALLDQFDIFADVVSQRSEHETGVWIAGLDVLAKDALIVKGNYIEQLPVICYLDRGHGAAIRRARTRLPGGDENPVAVIKIPRERMVASGIGSSLVHEAGHQASALLDLIVSIKPVLEAMALKDLKHSAAWKLFSRWISEILSDFWAVCFLGISATTGLMSVVSLPKYFVFRAVDNDPHPFPWIRVKISLAFGKLLYADDQWQRLERLWESMYPTTDVNPATNSIIANLQSALEPFARLIIEHKPASLKGLPLHKIFPLQARQPERLRQLFKEWMDNHELIAKQRPTLVFAVIGQARADDAISPNNENQLLSKMLKHWALVNI